jgi:hypothetical protein
MGFFPKYFSLAGVKRFIFYRKNNPQLETKLDPQLESSSKQNICQFSYRLF